MWRGWCTGLVALVATLLLAVAQAQASAPVYAPLNRPGPPLSVPAAKLRSAFSCTSGVGIRSRPTPVLLVPGTNLDPGVNYSWNYERAFSAAGRPYCTITLPYHSMGDIQTAGEYLVYALRTMSHRTGRRIDILGFSQGGMVPRWALRFWPGTRKLVQDYVALDPSNHGTIAASGLCHTTCPPADWQQAADAHFIQALNSRAETFAGIDYTDVFSADDEIVVPNGNTSGSSSLHTGRGRISNIRVQDICPGDTSDHLAMGTYDPVGYALAIDALTHPGPAKAARISRAVCSRRYQPGVDPNTFPSDYAAYLAAIARDQAAAPEVSAEPALRCYVFASCPRAPSQPAHARSLRKRPGRLRPN